MTVIINEGTLAQMAKDTSRELLPTMIDVYVNEISKRSEQLVDALQMKDCSQLSDLAHAIKSASGTFGADLLHEQAKVIEAKMKEQNISDEEIASNICELEKTIVATKEAFYNYKQTL